MAAPAFRSVSTAVAVASGNITLTLPAGNAQGDILVAAISYRDTAPFTVPTGWTLIAQESQGDTGDNLSSSRASGIMAWMERGASAPTDLIFTRTGGNAAIGRITAFNPGGVSHVLDASSSLTAAANAQATVAPSITTAVSDELLVFAACGGRNLTFSGYAAATDPLAASWTEHADSGTATGVDTALAIASAPKATAGATGNVTATFTGNHRGVGILAAFKPAGGGGATNYPLAAAVGTTAISGQSVGLQVARKVAVGANAFAVSGQNVALRPGRKLAVEVGATAITGQNVTLRSGRKLAVAPGGFAINGQPVALSYASTGPQHYGLVASAATFNVSGQSVGFRSTRAISVTAAAVSIGGQAIALKRIARLSVGAGSVGVAGQNVTLAADIAEPAQHYVLSAGAGAITVSGQAVKLTYKKIGSGGGRRPIIGNNPYWLPVKHYVLDVEPALFRITGHPVEFVRGIDIESDDIEVLLMAA